MADPKKTEIASAATDPYVSQFQAVLQPTDETIATRGGAEGLKLYDEIRRDPHAYAVLQKRKLEVTHREWMIEPASSRRIDKQAAAEVERQFKAMNIDLLTKGLMGAVLKGFSVAEILWTHDGTFWVARPKVKKQRRFRFDIDGNLRVLTRAKPVEGEPVPERKFIVHRHSIDDDEDDPYGVGIGSVLFWPAWFKRQVLAHWLRSSEKHGTPTVMASYQGGFDEKKQDQLLSVLRNLASDNALVAPENVKFDLLESRSTGQSHEDLARYLDELMSEAVLGETLSTNSGERGARSLGEIHNEVRLAIAKADADLISATIREQLIRPIVELNFPGAAMPEFWRDFSEAEDLDKRADRDVKIGQMGYRPASVDYINETYGGDWVDEKAADRAAVAQAGTPAAAQGETPPATAGLEFADPAASNQDRVVADLSDQLETLAGPGLEAMLSEIEAEFKAANSYDDLVQRLARLSGELGVDDLAGVLEKAVTLAELEGVASVDG